MENYQLKKKPILIKEKIYWKLVFFTEKKFPNLFFKLKQAKRQIHDLIELKFLIKCAPGVCFGMIREKKPQIIGMTTEWEQSYVRWFSKEKFTGEGEIVDLGCWLGSISISSAEGLQENNFVKNKILRINAFDGFVWKDWMDTFLPDKNFDKHYRKNADFKTEFNERIKDYKKYIRVRKVDIKNAKWERGNKIEFLFNDASESWTTANDIVHIFFPSLILGKSIYIEQNFYYHNCYWIHLISYKLKNFFKPLFQIPNSASAVFIYKEKIPQKILEKNYSNSDFSDEEVEAAFDWAMKLKNSHWKIDVLAAKSICLLERKKIKESKKIYSKIKSLQGDYPKDHLKAYFKDFRAKYRYVKNEK